MILVRIIMNVLPEKQKEVLQTLLSLIEILAIYRYGVKTISKIDML